MHICERGKNNLLLTRCCFYELIIRLESQGDYVSGKFGLALPLVIFGGASITAGAMTMMLPETLHRKLPETIRDGIEFGK